MFGGPRFFLVEMLTEILLFGLLVATGVVYRRRAELHQPLMLMATVVVLSGALARCPLIDALAATAPLYAYGPVILFGLLLLVIQWAITRQINRWYALTLNGQGGRGCRAGADIRSRQRLRDRRAYFSLTERGSETRAMPR